MNWYIHSAYQCLHLLVNYILDRKLLTTDTVDLLSHNIRICHIILDLLSSIILEAFVSSTGGWCRTKAKSIICIFWKNLLEYVKMWPTGNQPLMICYVKTVEIVKLSYIFVAKQEI